MKTLTFSLAFCALVLSTLAAAEAQLIINTDQPIDMRVTLNPILLSNDDGSNTAEFFGTGSQELAIKDFIDDIWAQAGIDVEWQALEFWDNSFVNIGAGGTRPTSDLSASVSAANTAGLLDPDPNVLNIFFVEVAAGFPDLPDNTANGLAFVGGNGISQHVGDNLPTFGAGREVAASVVAHEIGHNLGLSHIPEAENLMQAGGSPNRGQRLNTTQIAAARASSFSVVIAVPEPNSMLVVAAIGLLAAARRRR